MATSTTKTSAASKTPRARTPKVETAAVQEKNVTELTPPEEAPVSYALKMDEPVTAEATVTHRAVEVYTPSAAPARSVQLDPTSYVTVRSGFNGRLVYRSKKTGEVYVWKDFGQEHDMELQELKNARNTSREFFEHNWFMLDDPEVIKWLGVQEYYRTSLSVNDFDSLFRKKPEEIERIVASLPAGQRETLINRARELIAADDPALDSIRVIRALERSLGVKLEQ